MRLSDTSRVTFHTFLSRSATCLLLHVTFFFPCGSFIFTRLFPYDSWFTFVIFDMIRLFSHKIFFKRFSYFYIRFVYFFFKKRSYSFHRHVIFLNRIYLFSNDLLFTIDFFARDFFTRLISFHMGLLLHESCVLTWFFLFIFFYVIHLFPVDSFVYKWNFFRRDSFISARFLHVAHLLLFSRVTFQDIPYISYSHNVNAIRFFSP